MLPFVIVGIFVASLIGAVVSVALHTWLLSVVFILIAGGFGYWIFNGSLNIVQHVGRFYWIIRDNGLSIDPHVSFGFMRMVDPPWLEGRGPQIRVGKFVLQFGWCRPGQIMEEVDGLLFAMKGREMEETPKEIRNWHGTQSVDKEEV